MRHDDFLDKLIEWANRNNSVRVAIQTGSHTRIDNTADDLSDFDIELFVDDLNKFSSSNDWIQSIEKVWTILPLENSVGDPTRLVIFNDGIKVDFTLNKLEEIEKIKESEYDDYFNKGFKVLVDKDQLAKELPPPSYKTLATKRPTQDEFTALVEEFFFEAYHVAKYLRRGSLWAVKFRDWTTKELLLRMIEWYEKSIHGWDYDTWYLGQKIEKWAEKDLYADLQHVFSHFDVEDSWKALEATVQLFRRIAKETSTKLNYSYPQEVDDNISNYIESLK